MYFSTKSHLKSNRNHTAKHVNPVLKCQVITSCPDVEPAHMKKDQAQNKSCHVLHETLQLFKMIFIKKNKLR
jgi:hypothetical protein